LIKVPLIRPYESFAQAFLAEAKVGRLVFARCSACKSTQGYTRRICECGSGEIDWMPASGKGWIVSHITYWRAYSDSFPPPYTVVRVALDEGPRLSALWSDYAYPIPTTGTVVHLRLDAQARLLADIA
jgi:uncharacterized OB-fold protein